MSNQNFEEFEEFEYLRLPNEIFWANVLSETLVRGLTFNTLAVHMNVRPSVLYEGYKYKRDLRINTASEIAITLGVTLDDLLTP